MPSRKSCIDDLAKKAGRTKKETEDILDAIDARAEGYQDEGLAAGEAYQRARDEELANESEKAAIQRRAAIMDKRKDVQRTRDYNAAMAQIEKLPAGKRMLGKLKLQAAALAMEAKLVGTNVPFFKSRKSVAAQAVGAENRFVGGFEGDLEQAGLHKIFASRVIENNIVAELHELNKKPSAAYTRAAAMGEAGERDVYELGLKGQGPGNPGRTKDAQALAIAKIVQKWQKATMDALNAEGAWIRTYSGFITKQTHDADDISRAGQEAWVSRIASDKDFDPIRTFGTSDPQRVRDSLRALFPAMSSGDHFDYGKATDEPLYPMPAKTASASREIHWKTGDGWLRYNEDFGLYNPTRTIVESLRLAANRVALMKEFGTEPRKAYESDKKMLLAKLQAAQGAASAKLGAVEEAHRSAAAGSAEQKTLAQQMAGLSKEVTEATDRFKNFKSWQQALDNRFAQIDGTSKRPINAPLANAVNNIMSVQRMSKLGNLLTTHLASLPTKTSEAAYWGIPFAERYGSLFRGLTQGLKGSAQREAADLILIGAENRLGRMMNRYDVADAPSGALNKMEETFFRLTGANAVLDNQRSDFVRMAAGFVGSKRELDWDKVDFSLQRVLQQYGIGEKEWKALKGVEWSKLSDGRTYLFPSDILKATDDQIRAYMKETGEFQHAEPSAQDIERGRQDLALSLATAYTDRSGFAIPMPSARTRAILFRSAYTPGDPLNTALKLFYQFKMWPIDMMNRAWGREMYGRIGDGKYGRVANMVEMVVAGIVFGTAAEGLRDLIKGQDPLAKLRNHPFASLAQGAQRSGMGAIVGDYLLGQYDRHGFTPVDQFAGPTYGQLNNLVDLLGAGEIGREKGEFSKQAWKERGADLLRIMKDNTPYMNLWLTHLGTDTLIWHRLQEWINPGYLKRSEQRQQQLQGTQFMISPAKTDNWITGRRASPF